MIYDSIPKNERENCVVSFQFDDHAKIFDKRESKIVKTFDDVHAGNAFDRFVKKFFRIFNACVIDIVNYARLQDWKSPLYLKDLREKKILPYLNKIVLTRLMRS